MTQSKNFLALSLALVSGFLFSSHAEACFSSRDPRLNYFISYERPYAGLFADGAAVSEIRPTVVDRCQGSGEFLMVALTVRTQKIGGRTADVSFTNKFSKDSCRLENNPFPVAQTYEQKLDFFNQQYKLLRTCTFYDIVDIDDNEIYLPTEGQPAAKVEVLSKSHIRAEGDFVYIRTRKNNRFAIGVGLKKECTRPDFIKRMGLEAGELQSLLNTYIAGDASGITTDLTPIGSTRVRLALTPGSELMEVSSTEEANNVPSWPSIYKTNVEFGSLEVRPDSDGRAKVDFIPLADNIGQTRCTMGICSSENSYQSPVAGLVELVDLSGARRKVVDSWYFGSVAPAQYQGFVESVAKYTEPGVFRIGRHYQLEMSMVDPYEDYQLFKSGMSQMMVDLGDLNSVAGMDVFQSLGSLASLGGLRSLNGLSGLNSGDAAGLIQDSIRELTQINQGLQQWPPYFSRVCLDKGDTCYKRGQAKFVKKIGAEFTVGEIGPNGAYQLENLKIYSRDPLHGYRERASSKMPRVNCSVSNF